MKIVSAKHIVAASKWKPTGDSTRVGFFIRLPESLAQQFPSLGDQDDSPTHVTFFNIGEIPKDRQDEFIDKVKSLFLTFRGPVHASLGPMDYFTHPGKERRVAHLTVQFNKSISQWRSLLHDLVVYDMGIPVGDFNPMVYNPHVTLEYVDGLDVGYLGDLPQGHWSFNSIEIWGLPKHHIIPLGLETSVRVAKLWDLSQRVASRYQDKIETDDGNVIYQYGPRQVSNRHKKKADKLEKLKSSIGKLTTKVRGDLKSTDPKKKLTALAIALINDTYERVGNSSSAEEGHFGVTGWLVDHVKFSKNKATLSYVGKSGVEQSKVITDPTLVSTLKDVSKEIKKGGEIFSGVGATDVNQYLKEFGVTAKDLRGYHANREMCRVLKEIRKKGPALPTPRKERDKILKDEFAKALEEVAKIVGHEKATLRSDYLVPGLEDGYMKDGTVIESYNKKSSGKTAELLPVMDPLFNFRQIVKEILLLEDHLAHPNMRCPDCINKHLLKIEGYADEAITLDAPPELIDMADAVSAIAKSFFTLFGIGVKEEESWLDVQQLLRRTRKILMPYAQRIKVATKTLAEKEDEQIEKTQRRKPKNKPPRKDLHKDRMHVDDSDMDHGDRGDDKDLTLNYKRVAMRWSFRYATPMSLAHLCKVAVEQHGPGDVWQTNDGNWRAKNKDGESKGGFPDEKAAKKWVGGGGEKEVEDKKEETTAPEKEDALEEASDSEVNEAKGVIRQQKLEDAIQTRTDKEITKALKEDPNVTYDKDGILDHIYDRVENYILNTMSLGKKDQAKKLAPDAIEEMLGGAIQEAMDKSKSGELPAKEPSEEVQAKEDLLWENKNTPLKSKPKVLRSTQHKTVSRVVGEATEAMGDLSQMDSQILGDDTKKRIVDWYEKASDADWVGFSNAYENAIGELTNRQMTGEALDETLGDELNKVGDTPEDLAQALAKSRFLERHEDIKDALASDRDKNIEKKLKALGPKIQSLIEPNKRGNSLSKDVQERLLDLSIKFDDKQLERLSTAMEDKLTSLKKFRPEKGGSWDSGTVNLARQAIKEGVRGETPNEIGESLANLMFAEKIVMNPEFVGTPAIGQNSDYGEGKPTPQDLSNRAKSSFRQYHDMSDLDRVSAGERVKNLLKQEKDPKSPRSQELKSVLSGINLSQTIKGEKLTGQDHQPTSFFKELAKSLNKQGEAERLLGTMEDFTSNESRVIVNESIKRMGDKELAEFSGGKNGPYGAFAEVLSDTGKYTQGQRSQIRDILGDLITHRMSFGYSVMHDMYESAAAQNDEDFNTEDFGDLFDSKMNDWMKKSRFRDKDTEGAYDESIFEIDSDEDFDVEKWKEEIRRETMGEQNQELLNWAQSVNGGRPQKGESPAFEYMEQAQQDQKFDNVTQKTDPPLRKTAGKKLQSSFNISHYICDGEVYPIGNGGVSWSRRFLMARLTKKGAKSVVAQLERVAELFQNEHEALGINEKAALDFAYRCDLLSDTIEKNAGVEKEALSEFDPVKEQGFDPEEIGQEEGGPLQKESDEPYMNQQFSQQENRELRERQESGEIEKTKVTGPILDEQSPQSGKQALDESLVNLTRLAQDAASSVAQLSNMSDTLSLCLAKLDTVKAGPASDLAKKLGATVQTHITAFNKVRDALIKSEALNEPLDLIKEASLGRILRASGEVVPHLKELLSEIKNASEDSPTAQLLLQELLDQKSGRIGKLMTLSAKIVSDAAGDFGKKEPKTEKQAMAETSSTEDSTDYAHGFDLYAE